MKRYEDEKSKIIRESIGEAILSILSTQDFGEISVCDICTRAGVGRTTYYRYYGNKSGKEDAVYYWLINRWEAYTGCQTLSLAQTDQAFFSFIFSTVFFFNIVLLQYVRLRTRTHVFAAYIPL